MQTTPATMAGPALSPAEGLRHLSRINAAFILDLIAVLRGERHVLDTLLTAAIVQANGASSRAPADAICDEALPDEALRPISVSRLASSLGLPFETVRRRTTKMIVEGRCERRELGLLVPVRVLTDPDTERGCQATYGLVRAFWRDLRALGYAPPLEAPDAQRLPAQFLNRAVAQAAIDYLLRVAEIMARSRPDPLDGIIVLAIFHGNVSKLATAADDQLDAFGVIRDAHRSPVRVEALARRVGIPRETVRRRVAGLMREGVCRPARGGVIVPAKGLDPATMNAIVAENGANLLRLFGACAKLGVADDFLAEAG